MKTIRLPLDPLLVSIGTGAEPGPVLNDSDTPLQLSYDRIDADSLRQIAPDNVVSWLFCAAYDAYDVARVLLTSGFQGRYFAAAADLPNTGAVTREIRSSFPGLDFHLISPAQLSRQAASYHRFVARAGAKATAGPEMRPNRLQPA